MRSLPLRRTLPGTVSNVARLLHQSRSVHEEEYDEAFGYEFLGKKWETFSAIGTFSLSYIFFPSATVGQAIKLFKWIQGYQDYWDNRSCEGTVC